MWPVALGPHKWPGNGHSFSTQGGVVGGMGGGKRGRDTKGKSFETISNYENHLKVVQKQLLSLM